MQEADGSEHAAYSVMLPGRPHRLWVAEEELQRAS